MSDRELIEALATKVMGWRKSEYFFNVWLDDNEELIGDWNPLTDPAASKQVRDKLAERFQTLTLEQCGSSFYYGVLDPDMPQMMKETGDTFGADADTEERAVALCALASVGVEYAVRPV